MPSKRIVLLITLLAWACPIACAQTPTPIQTPAAITETGQDQVDFQSEKINQLSGIAWIAPQTYAVVSDKKGLLGFATIKIDPESGQITHAKIDRTVRVEDGRDLEGLALDAFGSLVVADEASQSITTHDASTGRKIESIAVPKLFQDARPNRGLESLSISLTDGMMWTANEESLKGDGPLATKEAGTLIRLQQFDADKKPVAQYAYRTDAHRGAENLIKRAQSGVSDLLALPGGRLVVMERELGGSLVPSFRIRLYLIDTDQATDTSNLPSLIVEDLKPVAKTLLIELKTGRANYEGIALGPRLDRGDYAVLLVSDDGGGKTNPQNLLALRLSADLAEGDTATPRQALDSASDALSAWALPGLRW